MESDIWIGRVFDILGFSEIGRQSPRQVVRGLRALARRRSNLLSLLALSVFYIILQSNLFGYSASLSKSIAIAYTLLPIFALWFILRMVLTPVQAALLVAWFLSLISWASLVKQSATNLPLSWNDIFFPKDLGFFEKYVVSSPMLFLVVVLGVLAIVSLLQIKIPRPAWGRVIVSCCASIIAMALLFAPLGNDKTSWQVRTYLQEQGVFYVSWDWDTNARENGILLHLFQTSAKPLPGKPSPSEENTYKVLLGSDSIPEQQSTNSRPKTVIIILCEACWWDPANFSDTVESLSRIGFKQTRVISPVYGGGTANASIELLSGLPMNTKHLAGVIYQEYADLMRPKISNLAWSFRDAGYTSVAGHNWNRAFWRRDEVKPKLGFQEFIALDDLGWTGEGLPPDRILFDYVIKNVPSDDSGTFLYLTTMFTHGPYGAKGIEPSKDYEERLSKTAKDIEDFASSVLAKDAEALILVLGDHKPAMTAFFKEKAVIPVTEFEAGTDRRIFDFSHQIWGEVPALVLHSNSMAVDKLLTSTSDKPFYCLNFYLDSIFLGFSTPVQKYIRDEEICEGYESSGYRNNVDAFPEWLYYETFFGGQ
jgi:hypothetical protein